MPKVRSPRGTRTRFMPAKIQATISKAYAAAYGNDVSKWRKQIQEHSQRIVHSLGLAHGTDVDAEWPRSSIGLAIEQELRKTAASEVHECYLDQHPERRPRKSGWSKFEGKQDLEEDDPFWSIQKPSLAPTPAPIQERGIMDQLGTAARTRKVPAKEGRARAPGSRPCLRSDWARFLGEMSKQSRLPLPNGFLEGTIGAMKIGHTVKSPEDWWWFWQDFIEQTLLDAPRNVDVMRLLYLRRERARLCGQDWLDGSEMPGYEGTRLLLSDDATGKALYRRLWQEHMTWWIGQEDARPGFGDYDLARLAGALDPLADHAIGWAAYQWLSSSEGAWPIQVRTWRQVPAMPHSEAVEPPQWAFMRLAMALAMPESKEVRHEKAIEFYEALSSLSVAPSDAMLREAGRISPRFCEDGAMAVRDRFEDVQEAIHRAGIETKWNGTLSLDWSPVRAQGSPVGGRRISQGVPGFLRAIDLAQRALGRSGEDRPVTVCLPLWHRDIEKFLGMRHEDADRLQVVVSIPDAFMNRARDGAPWWLLDPSDFPGLAEGHISYDEAVEQVEQQPAKYQSTAKKVSSNALWRKIIRAGTSGSPFVTFSDINAMGREGFHVLAGLDGVGALPISRQGAATPWCQWPTVAINLSRAVSMEGTPDLPSMRAAATIGMRMLDNALIECEHQLSHESRLFRPVCLGAVGYYEAIAKATETRMRDRELLNSWVHALGEAWFSVVEAADAALVKERGPAPCFVGAGAYPPYSPSHQSQLLVRKRGGSRMGPVIEDRPGLPAQRFAVRSVWAPFEGPACIAGVTPGGIGTLRPYYLLLDERRQGRLLPSPLMLHMMDRVEDDFTKTLRHPDNPAKWPIGLRKLTHPDLAEWNQRLHHASLLANWVDQGVSLTLPPGLSPNDLEHILHKAWMLGISNVRYDTIEDPARETMPRAEDSALDSAT